MTITAKFLNGFTDTYKGHRDVKAAWAIFSNVTGECLASGHSLDRVKAEKNATATLRDTYPAGVETNPTFIGHGGTQRQRAEKRARNERAMAERRVATTIEVVDI